MRDNDRNELLSANRRTAEDYGWSPADFGCDDYDQTLIKAIADFQSDRILVPTGYVDLLTFKCLKEQHKLAPLVEINRKRLAMRALHGIGWGNDRQVAPWTGVRLRLAPKFPVTAPHPPCDGLIVDIAHADKLPLSAHLRGQRDPIAGDDQVSGILWLGVRDDQVLATQQRLRKFLATKPQSITIGLLDSVLTECHDDPQRLVAAVDVMLDECGTVPVALAYRPTPYRKDPRRQPLLAELSGRFQVVQFLLPPVFSVAPEQWVKAALIQLCAAMQIRQSEVFPIFTLTPESLPDHVLRLRHWMRVRNYRGHAFTWPIPDHMHDAVFGEIPAEMVGFDYSTRAQAAQMRNHASRDTERSSGSEIHPQSAPHAADDAGPTGDGGNVDRQQAIGQVDGGSVPAGGDQRDHLRSAHGNRVRQRPARSGGRQSVGADRSGSAQTIVIDAGAE